MGQQVQGVDRLISILVLLESAGDAGQGVLALPQGSRWDLARLSELLDQAAALVGNQQLGAGVDATLLNGHGARAMNRSGVIKRFLVGCIPQVRDFGTLGLMKGCSRSGVCR